MCCRGISGLVLIPDHHPGFIDWATYETNTVRLRPNWHARRGTGGGAPREGAALLQGRLRCGKCSRLMQTGYSGVKGNSPRYVCARARQLYGGEKAARASADAGWNGRSSSGVTS